MSDSDKPNVAVVGRFQIGKSTLINCLLDDRVARTGSGVATTKISTVYHYGQFPEIEVARTRDRGGMVVWEPSGQRLLDFLAAGKEWRGISAAKIALWKPLLSQINLIDTPGIDANADDTAMAAASLEQADYFLVVLENRGLSDVERRLFTDIQRRGRPFSVVVNCRDRQGKRWIPKHNREIVDSLKAEFAILGIAPRPIGKGHGIWVCNLLWFWHASEHIYEDDNGEGLASDIAHYFHKHLKIAPTATNTCNRSNFEGLRLFFENNVWQKVRHEGGGTLSIASKNTLDFIKKLRKDHEKFADAIEAVLPLCWRSATPQYKPYEHMRKHRESYPDHPDDQKYCNIWHRDYATIAATHHFPMPNDAWIDKAADAMVGWLHGVLHRMLEPYLGGCDKSIREGTLENIGDHCGSLEIDRFRHEIKVELFVLRDKHHENMGRWQNLQKSAKSRLIRHGPGGWIFAAGPEDYWKEAEAVLKNSDKFFAQGDEVLENAVTQLVEFWRNAFPILETLILHLGAHDADLSVYAYDQPTVVMNLPLLPKSIFTEQMEVFASRDLENPEYDHELRTKLFCLYRRMGIPIEQCP